MLVYRPVFVKPRLLFQSKYHHEMGHLNDVHKFNMQFCKINLCECRTKYYNMITRMNVITESRMYLIIQL